MLNYAEGELQASGKLMQAVQILSQQSGAMQLRYLQTLTNIATDKSNTTIFPIPMGLMALTDALKNRNLEVSRTSDVTVRNRINQPEENLGK